MDYVDVLIGVGGFLVAIMLAVVAGKFVEAKGYPFALGFWASFFAPVIGWAILVWLPDRPQKPRVNPELQLQIELELAKRALLRTGETPAGPAAVR